MKHEIPIGGSLFFIVLLLLFFNTGYAQQSTQKITGTVLTDEGEELPGVTIVVKGTTTGTITDISGHFSINVPQDNPTLVFSYVGYVSEEVDVTGKSDISISLTADISQLSEVVVVGYGEQKKETLTGSITQVKGKEIAKSPQPNVTNSLAGRFPGVIANNRSGEPGYDDSDFYVRGLATTGSNDVLVVVDGVPGQIGGLSRLNPNDIENVTILKDASAAIYGSRAANGVILVTTKKGDQGKPLINYSFDLGFSSPTRLPDMANAATYAAIQNEISYYNNTDGGMYQSYTAEEIEKFANGSDPLNYPNTDWAEATLKDFSVQRQHNLSISGGNENIRYFVSLGKLFQDGLYEDGATKYNQYNFRSNIDADINDNLTVGLLLSGRQEDRKYPVASAGNIFRSIYRAYPTVADRYPNGLMSWGIEGSNPVAMVTDIGGTSKNPTSIFNGILKAAYKIPGVEGLSVDGFLSADKKWNFTKTFSKPYTLYEYNSADDTYDAKITGGSAEAATLTESQVNTSLITKNIKLNYERQLGLHHLSTFIGYEQSKNHVEDFGATSINYPTSETPELSQGGAASSDSDNYGSSYNYTRRSYIGRVAYDYNEKYMAEVQLRVDGSSIFPEGNQYGYFPAISAGWRISEEPWFEGVSFINDLKIRGSYGQLGNDNVDQFQYYNNYSFNNVYVIGDEIQAGVDLTKLANEDITWEVAKKTDIGLNMTVLKNISMEFVYFRQNRSDILTARNASIPGVSGIVNPYDADNPLVPDENIGEVSNNGFEFTLSYHKDKGDFWYNLSGNMTYAKSEIKFIDEASSVLSYQRETGRSLNTYLLYDVIGIFRDEEDLSNYTHLDEAQPGDLIYDDYNGDGEIDADDMTRSKYGNIPEVTYGFNLSGGWKNFDVSILITGQTRVSQYVLPESGTVGNFYSSWADNRWSPTNPNGSYPRVDERASSSINGGLYTNNFWLNNASFIRLKNIVVGYNLPPDVVSKMGITALRIQASAFNLFTITDVEDYDPEGSSESGQFYPQQKIISLGVNVKF